MNATSRVVEPLELTKALDIGTLRNAQPLSYVETVRVIFQNGKILSFALSVAPESKLTKLKSLPHCDTDVPLICTGHCSEYY